MSIFKVEFALWVGDDAFVPRAGACARDHVEADFDSWILDWKEKEMILSEAPWVGHMCEGCPECEGGKS
tara:strand:- start:121 stop:327 length:207 start_codon:yes stop_codon:yes gene_type:complete